MSERNLVGRVFRRVAGPPVEWVGRRVEQQVRTAMPDFPKPPVWVAPVAVLSGMVGAVVVQLVGGRGGGGNPHPAGAERERASREPAASGERGTTSASDEDAEVVEVARALLTLGVEEPDESKAKAAYRSLVVETHPDQGGDAEEFKTIREAWETVESSERLSGDVQDDRGN